MSQIVSLKPYQYAWILDTNKNTVSTLTGPCIRAIPTHETVLRGPLDMVVVPPGHVCKIKLLHQGDEVYRTHGPPFALLPTEELVGDVVPLQLVPVGCALRIKVVRPYDGREAGDEYLLPGPLTYVPRVEEEVMKLVEPTLVTRDAALMLTALRTFTDTRDNVVRKVGDKWLMKRQGLFLPAVWESIVGVLSPYVLDERTAVHVRALASHTDVFGVKRRAGEQWLVTHSQTELFMPDVTQEVVGLVQATVLGQQDYCCVLNAVGERVLRRGPARFFLQPLERLEGGIINAAFILKNEEALLVKAVDAHDKRKPGEVWLIRGPAQYVPPIQVAVLKLQQAIALDKSEGVYVRNTQTGLVRIVTACSCMLEPHEELWQKPLPLEVEQLLQQATGQARDRNRAVTFRARANSAVRIYDYVANKGRTVFGPAFIMLGPDEQVTVWSLSGDKPKRPHVIKSLELLQGPDFMTDIFSVETLDHAKLTLKLSYSWRFEPSEAMFAVPDFVGQACQANAAKVRGAVAAVSFDELHQRAAKIIRTAVLGVNAETGRVNDQFRFAANGLLITNVDIQNVEPVDQKTRESLVKSVQQAIEIATSQQEAVAKHAAAIADQRARGELTRLKLEDAMLLEDLKQRYMRLETDTKTVEAVADATAKASAESKTMEIEAETDKIKLTLEMEARLLQMKHVHDSARALEMERLAHERALQKLELDQREALVSIDTGKLEAMMTALGPGTLEELARAGPETQARLLRGLGIKSMLLTDGKSPVNLFGTAQQFVTMKAGGVAK